MEGLGVEEVTFFIEPRIGPTVLSANSIVDLAPPVIGKEPLTPTGGTSSGEERAEDECHS